MIEQKPVRAHVLDGLDEPLEIDRFDDLTVDAEIWDYADDKLVEAGETVALYERHLDYFVSFAEQAELELCGPNQKIWLEKLRADHHNLNRALKTSLERPETRERGLRIAGAISRYWEVRSYLPTRQRQDDHGQDLYEADKSKREGGVLRIGAQSLIDLPTHRHRLHLHGQREKTASEDEVAVIWIA